MKGLLHSLRRSVRGRLAFLVAAIAVPAILLVGLLVFQAYRNERQTVGQHLIATARAIASLVDRQIGQSEALLKGLAASRDLVRGDMAAFHEHATSVVRGTDQWIVLTDANGQQLVNTRVPFGSSAAHNPADAEHIAAVEGGRTYVSNVVWRDEVQQFTVYVVVPVIEAGRLKYALRLAMPAMGFANTLHAERFSPGTVVTIMDRTGTIVMRDPHGDRYVGRKAMPDIVEASTIRGEGSHQSVTLEGKPVLAVYSRASVSGWGVAMGVAVADLYASAKRLLWPGLATSAVLLLTAILMAAWIGRSLVRGIETLAADTEKMGRGMVPPVRESGLAETDFVSEVMRKSATQLKQRDDENAALAAALTDELEARKRTEESSRRLAAIVESSDDAIISKNMEGVVTSWNRGAERLFGYRADEMIGQPISLLIPANRQDEGPAILNRIRKGIRIDHFETYRRKKDGSLIPISLVISPLYDEQGRVVGASKISRDISQRHATELQQQTLYELAARVNRAEALPEIYDAALDAMGRCSEASRAAVLLTDSAGAMKFVSTRRLSETYCRAVEGHSPWPPGETHPTPICIDNVATSDLAPELKAAMQAEGIQALAFVPLTYEKRLLGKFMIYFDAPHAFAKGELRPVETIASQVSFAIERQQGAEALEALVNDRTASLRQIMAQMEEFSYSVSHDLRAPVRAMRGYADVILQDHGWRLEAEARELLTRIARSGERMDRLIQDLLTYSRISRREVTLEAVSLDKLVREVMQQYPDMRPEKADIEVEGRLPDVIAHEPSLTQVVSNLLSNAVKFVPPHGRARVRVRADQRDSRARLWIMDNGIGIKPEHQSRLFGMFERIHPESEYEGTGIGLAIVRKAIERMNGTVGVESDGISGSRFWVDLPMAQTNGNGSGPDAHA
jgi:PAS domain S-box-containing protein